MHYFVGPIDLPAEASLGAVDVYGAAVRLACSDAGERRGTDHTAGEFDEDTHIVLGIDVDRLTIAVPGGPKSGEPCIDLGDPPASDIFGQIKPMHAQICCGIGRSCDRRIESPSPVVVIGVPGPEPAADGVDLTQLAGEDSCAQLGDHRI